MSKSKKMMGIFAILIVIIFAISVVGCTGKITLTYRDGDGTEVTAVTQQIAAGAEVALGDSHFTKEGYTLLGWTDEDGNFYKVTDTYTAPKKDTTLTAKWGKNILNVRFVDEDGVTVLDSTEVARDTKATFIGNEPTKAATAEKTYTFSGWSPSLTETVITADTVFTAVYAESAREYKVTFKNADGSILPHSTNIPYGAKATYTGENPTKAATAEKTYTFSGWSPSLTETVIIKDTEFTATYTEKVREYKVTFKDEDGVTVLASTEVSRDTKASFTGENPTKAATAEKTYTFSGWSPSLTETVIIKDTEFTATYTEKVREYTVTFKDEDGTILPHSASIPYGAKASFTGENPTKAATAEKTYTFSGWSPSLTETVITGDTEFTATYTEKVREYKVTFKDEDGTILPYPASIPYGAKATYTGENPTKAATAEKAYTFSGWSPSLTETVIIKDTEFTATYTEKVREYTVTFKDEDGVTVLASTEVSRDTKATYTGENPTKASTAEKTYTFSGWSPSLTETVIIKDTEFTATYTEKVREYTVTFKNADGQMIQSGLVPYGTLPVAPENGVDLPQSIVVDETTLHVFDGWDTEIVPTTGEATYTAKYRKEVRVYSLAFAANEFVTFADESGNAITSLSGTYRATQTFKVVKNKGVYWEDMVVKLGASELVSADGSYTVTFTKDGETVIAENFRFVSYEVTIRTSNASASDGAVTATFGTPYTFRAKGTAGCITNAPAVSIGASTEIIAPVSNIKDAGGYFTYVLNIEQNGEIKVTGVTDIIQLTYIDIYGGEHSEIWDITHVAVGNTYGDGTYNAPYDILEGSKTDTTAYEVLTKSKFPSDGVLAFGSFFLVTTDAAESGRTMTKQEVTAELDTYLPRIPVAGEQNIYYIIYVKSETPNTFKVGLSVPSNATEVQYLNGETWKKMKIGYENNFPNYYVDGRAYNTQLSIKFTLPEGVPYPTLRDGDLSAEPSDNIYTFTVTMELNWTAADVEFHGVRFLFTDSDKAVVKLYNEEGNLFEGQGNGEPEKYNAIRINVANGAEFKFRLVFDEYLTGINQYSAEELWTGEFGVYVDGVKVKEVPVPKFGGEYILSAGKITEDAVITIVIPKVRTHNFEFTLPGTYDIEVDGTVLEGAAGNKVTAPVWNGKTKIRLIPPVRKSFECPDGFNPSMDISGTTEGVTNISFDVKGGNATDGYIWSCTVKNDWLSDIIGAGPDAKGIVTMCYDGLIAASATVKQIKPDNRITVDAAQPKTVKLGEDYIIRIKVPNGSIPKLYVEYLDNPSDGVLPVKNVQEVTGDFTHTFTIKNVTCDVTWFILLEKMVYPVTFHYGTNNETIALAHGALIEGNSLLPVTFEGEKDGKRGTFTITGWSTTESGTFANYIQVTGATDVWAVTTFQEFTYEAEFNKVSYRTVGEAIASLSSSSAGDLYVVYLPSLTALATGEYVIPKGVTMWLPYAEDKYGRTLAAGSDAPSIFYAQESAGRIMLTIPKGATLTVYGTLSVGGVVGCPTTAMPYQGQTSAAHAIVQLDGTLIIEKGGELQVNGYITGDGKVEVLSGGASFLPFIVKDYRGGSNSATVFDQNTSPFNVFEMPNILTSYTVNYGAKEFAYAMLFASGDYNVIEMEVLGAKGMIHLKAGGRIEKKTAKIANPRYSNETKAYEPPFEFRTALDIYGGATDGIMNLEMLNSSALTMGISYTYQLRLMDGVSDICNAYKIMPGGSLTVMKGATLNIKTSTEAIGAITTYDKDFKDNSGTIKDWDTSHKQLFYPQYPNGIENAEDGKFIVNGTLKVYGKLGADVLTTEAGAMIQVFSISTYLQYTAKEGIALQGNYQETYNKTKTATVNGDTALQQGEVWVSQAADGKIAWKK